MNFYEADMLRMQRRIKELEENPGQRLKCLQIVLRQKIEFRKKQIEAYHQGELQPLADFDPMATSLFRAMGFTEYERGPASSQRDEGFSGGMSPEAHKEKARTVLGLPVDTACQQCYLLAGAVAAGSMPMEPLVITTNCLCPMMVQQKLVMVHKWPHDTFHFNIPAEETEANVEYIVSQFREFIEVAEKRFPGVIKYDEEKLAELLAKEKVAARYNREIYEMIKHQPSPIAGRDIWESGAWDHKDLEYLRARRDELAERIEKGIAAVPGEKLRVLWVHTQIHFFNPFKILEKHGAAAIFWFSNNVVHGHQAPIPRPAYYGGRQLTPLEEEAAHTLAAMKSGTGAHYVDNLIMVARDLKIDAIISFQEIGTTCLLGLRRIIAERAEKELGIPTLDLEGKRWDPSFADEATMTAKLNEFAQMCLSRKGLT